MKTLLEPGDMIRIRKDIKEDMSYKMIFNSDSSNSYIKHMAKPGELIKIRTITTFGQYKIESKTSKYAELWDYTDEMFDPESIQLILENKNL